MLRPCALHRFSLFSPLLFDSPPAELLSRALLAPHPGMQGSNGIGSASVGTLVDTPLEAMTRASDLPSRHADAPLCRVASQTLRSASLDCSCTLEWARDDTFQCGTDASNLVSSRMKQSAVVLVTAPCRSKIRNS